ncbi:DUF4157 domain-containing protein [Pendulispora albinea]|uniref:DUF4157 domain-containing protein n=1 Tax=Pendulispora albinea TaxID=2741071 RepID=A0ABZ2LZ95_9BACT
MGWCSSSRIRRGFWRISVIHVLRDERARSGPDALVSKVAKMQFGIVATLQDATSRGHIRALLGVEHAAQTLHQPVRSDLGDEGVANVQHIDFGGPMSGGRIFAQKPQPRATRSRLVAPKPAPKHASALQAKWAIGAVDDPLEREADRIAERVLGMSDSAASLGLAIGSHVPSSAPASAGAGPSPGVMQRRCEACEDDKQEDGPTIGRNADIRRRVDPDADEELEPGEEDSVLAPAPQAKATSGTGFAPGEGVRSAIARGLAGGEPLSRAARAFFEPRFGYDFRRVRVHADGSAAAAAHAVGAYAFTLGRDVVFGAGQYAPDTRKGRQLLAHELTHVIQQDHASRTEGSAGGLRHGDIAQRTAVIRRRVADAAMCGGATASPDRDRANGPFQQLFEGKPKKDTKKSEPASRKACDDKCGASGSFGSTECEIDLESGFLTGRVTKAVTDTSPCTRPCVELHEGVHAKRIGPVCAAVKKCQDAARGNIEKKEKCLDQHDGIERLTFSTECAAYIAEEKCLNRRAGKAECKSADGKKRWDEQMKMVKCYKACFCKT